MNNNIVEKWDAEQGLATCILYYTTSTGVPLAGVGLAECHPEDRDFISERTGSIIAEYRAEIDLLKKINNFEIKPSIAALKHVYCTMLHSKQYNPNSYEAKRLKKELAHLLDELEENKQSITSIQTTLNTYISEKDKLYKRIRNGQNKANI